MWMFPEVKNASESRVRTKNTKAPSTMRRKVGCKDEPGSRIVEKKEVMGSAGNGATDAWAITSVVVAICS